MTFAASATASAAATNPQVLIERMGQSATHQLGPIGAITLNRPAALNALSLGMVRSIASALTDWAADESVLAVVMRGSGKDAAAPHFGHFCAGGDIRYFFDCAKNGDPTLEDFFTEEYALNHQISLFPKPMVWLLDGVVMGGGMGLCAHNPSQSTLGQPQPGRMRYRVGTERVQMAMPETLIGLFPDVGGGWFLGQSVANSTQMPQFLGEYLALCGPTLKLSESAAVGWLDAALPSAQLHSFWASLAANTWSSPQSITDWVATNTEATNPMNSATDGQFGSKLRFVDGFFGAPTVLQMVQALEAAARDESPQDQTSENPARAAFAQECAQALRKRSPLALEVTLQQIRRARGMGLASALRMERDMVRNCFHPFHLQRSGVQTDTAEGIRALAVDKDHAPRWSPARLEGVSSAMVEPYFASPWPAHAHPLRGL